MRNIIYFRFLVDSSGSYKNNYKNNHYEMKKYTYKYKKDKIVYRAPKNVLRYLNNYLNSKD